MPALEDCNPDLRRGVVTVCRWGGEVVWGAEAGGAEGGVAGWCGGLFPSFYWCNSMYMSSARVSVCTVRRPAC